MQTMKEWQAEYAQWQAKMDSPEWANCTSLCLKEAAPQPPVSPVQLLTEYALGAILAALIIGSLIRSAVRRLG